MEKWQYKSLDWIHKVRKENYEKTKDLSPAELIEHTHKATDAAIKGMGLKVVRSKGPVRTH